MMQALPATFVAGVILVIAAFQMFPTNVGYAASDVPTLDLSTRFGGGSGLGMAVDDMGATYITGPTRSPFFENGNVYGDFRVNDNAFVVKFSVAGTVEWTTLIGGSGNDHGLEVAVGSDSVWMAGWTDSVDFHTTDTTSGNDGDMFLVRLDRWTGELSTSSVIGYGAGAGQPQQVDLAIDASDCLYIAGNTAGTETDIFVKKLSPLGGLLYDFVTGGSGDDKAYGIALDSQGRANVTGGTSSSDFPGLQGSLTGPTDAFVLIVDVTGSYVEYGTYLGGNEAGGVQGNEWGAGIAVDQATGWIYIAGRTSALDFTVVNAFDDTYNGGSDAFLTVLDSTGAVHYSTFLGGSSNGSARAVSIDSSGNAFVYGRTWSGFPTKNAYDDSFNGKQDLFLAKLDPNAAGPNSLVSSTYFGGKGTDGDGGMVLTEGPNGVSIFLTGWTHSRDFDTTDGSDGGVFLSLFKFAPQGVPASSVHVGDISLTTAAAGQGMKHGRAYVTIVDNLGIPVANVSVTGRFSGDLVETLTFPTDSNGVAVFETSDAKKGALSFSFCVDDVSASLDYDPGANTPTCASF